MKFVPTIKRPATRGNKNASEVQCEFAMWLLTKTNIPRGSFIGDLAFHWVF